MGLFKKIKDKAQKDEAETVVDVRDEPVVDLTDGPRKIEWGFPTRCPECGDYGYLDRIDVVREIMFQHCPTCWAKWETRRSETADA